MMAVEPLFKQAPNTRSIRSLGVASGVGVARKIRGCKGGGEELGSGTGYPFLDPSPLRNLCCISLSFCHIPSYTFPKIALNTAPLKTSETLHHKIAARWSHHPPSLLLTESTATHNPPQTRKPSTIKSRQVVAPSTLPPPYGVDGKPYSFPEYTLASCPPPAPKEKKRPPPPPSYTKTLKKLSPLNTYYLSSFLSLLSLILLLF